jgi:ribosomal protein L35
MPKTKPNKSLLKRIRITKNGKVRFRRACGRHLKSHKAASLIRSYRKPIYAKAGEARRVANLLFMSASSPEQVAKRRQRKAARRASGSGGAAAPAAD